MKIILAAGAMILFAGAVFAETINIQNANFVETNSKVVVTGRLIDFGKINNVTINDTLTGELLAELSGIRTGFIAQIDRGTDRAVPCSVTVTSGVESASMDVRFAPVDCSNRFTLSGIVTDSALPFATVVVHVGGQTFTTVADENGFYSLDIAAATVGDLVTIEAEATNPNDPGETVNFINLVGTFSKLLSDPVENVTNVTTAQFALLVEANGGQVPTTEQELRDAETHVDATKLLALAAVIKLIVDDPEYSLPDDFDSIVEFIADGDAVDQFIDATDPSAIEDTIVAILADNDLVEGFTAADIPSFYYAIRRAVPGFLSRGGNSYEFDDSTSGTFFSAQGGGGGLPISEEFQWVVTDGVLELSFPDPAPISWFGRSPEDATSDPALIAEYYNCALDLDEGITMHERLLETSLTRVVDGSLVDIASRTNRLEYSFDPVPTITSPDCTGISIQFDTLFEFETYEVTLRSSADITPLPFTEGPEGVDVLGSWGFANYFNPGAYLYYPAVRRVLHNLLTFNAGGAGSKLLDDQDLVDQTFTWQIVGNDLVISYPDGWTQTSRILDQEGKQYGVFHDFTNGTDRFASYDITVKRDPSFAFTEAYLLSPLDKFWNSVINHWIPDWLFVDGSWTFNSYWGWIFDPLPNGTLNAAWDGEGDRIWTVLPMTWEILPDGMLQRNYVSPGAPERQRFWTPLAEDPITEDPVTGEPIVPAMRRFYVLEYEEQAPDKRIQPRINIQQETDIPKYDIDIYRYCTPDWICTDTPYTP